MKLFKSFCKKELISRRVTLRNQKIGFSEKDLMIFKTCLLVLKMSIIVRHHKKQKGKVFFKFLAYQGALKKRMQLIGKMLRISTKKENLEKFSVIKELQGFVQKSRKGLNINIFLINRTTDQRLSRTHF